MVEQESISELIKLTLNHGVFHARDAEDMAQATALLDEWRPDVAVIDVEGLGAQLLWHIGRADAGSGMRIPVLALTRRGDLRTKLLAFERGVDDIMTVPFSPEELLARTLAITRRSHGQTLPLTPVVKVGDLQIDILNREVRIGSDRIHLTGLEMSLLYLLVANAGRVLSRDEITDVIWGVDYIAESNIVDRHILNLRTKLQNGSRHPRFIATVPGQGYRFIPTLDPAP